LPANFEEPMLPGLDEAQAPEALQPEVMRPPTSHPAPPVEAIEPPAPRIIISGK
jgi:hypothetical protein